jgi:peptidoglycan/LPS O-acetylase OafA/YrhL
MLASISQHGSAASVKSPAPHIRELDGLRAILSWWVVTIHLLTTAGIDLEQSWVLKQLFGATFRVKLFAILSGFVIANLLSSRPEPYHRYLTRRFLRLYPVYGVCLVASALLLDFDVRVLESLPWRSEVQRYWYTFHRAGQTDFWTHLAAHASMLHGLVPHQMLPEAAFAILGQSWNISTEWQFYVVAPPLVALVLSRRLVLQGVGLTLFLGIFCCRSYPNPAFLGNYILYYLAGILSFAAHRQITHRLQSGGPSTASIGGTSVLVVAVAFAVTRNLAIAIWLFIWSAVLVRLSTVGAVRVERAICRVMTLPVALYYGRLSYPIYLCHMLVVLPVAYATTRIFGYRIGPWGYFACVGTVSVPLISLLAHLLHVYLEAPAIAMGRRLSPHHRGTATQDGMTPPAPFVPLRARCTPGR